MDGYLIIFIDENRSNNKPQGRPLEGASVAKVERRRHQSVFGVHSLEVLSKKRIPTNIRDTVDKLAIIIFTVATVAPVDSREGGGMAREVSSTVTQRRVWFLLFCVPFFATLLLPLKEFSLRTASNL